MSLDQMQKEIRQEASRLRREAEKEAEAEAERIIKDAENASTALIEQAHKKAEEEALLKQSQVSAARLEAKKRVAEARDAVVAAQLSLVREALAEFADSNKYDAVLKDLAEQGAKALGANMRVLARKKDLAKLSKWGYTKVEAINCWGGCIVETAEGRIKVNNTFEALYEQSVEKLRQAVFEEL